MNRIETKQRISMLEHSLYPLLDQRDVVMKGESADRRIPELQDKLRELDATHIPTKSKLVDKPRK